MKKVIIIGATSGIGEEIAKIYIAQGWQVGIAGRREEAFNGLSATAPAQVKTQVIDVTSADAPEQLQSLIEKLGEWICSYSVRASVARM
jgi:NADP-dependent 3-hydroxy acid dehydrogenase YdfG